jgi:hypothetical protein
MKFILILLLTTGTIRAQVPHIDYMIADEAKSQLQIHGTFGPDHTGFVTIENTKQTVRSWSDTMLICDLPDSGAGSGGHVIVQQIGVASNVRILSIFQTTIIHDTFIDHGPGLPLEIFELLNWYVNWRVDINSRNHSNISTIPFEISKSSFGSSTYLGYSISDRKPWTDSSNIRDGSISLSGSVDISNHKVIFDTAFFIFADTDLVVIQKKQVKKHVYHPLIINFDTLGGINGYIDSGIYHSQYNSLSGEILFPSGVRNSVSRSLQLTTDLIKIFSHIGSEDHQISFEAEEPLGETTTSLYSIDGRLLKQEKISIPSAWIYSFDVSGVNARFGILVFKTDKGVFARKVFF